MENSKKIIFIVTNPLTPVVISQVLMLSEQVKNNGFSISVVFLLQAQHYKLYLKDRKKLREYSDIDSVFFCPYQYDFIGRFFAFFYLLKVRISNWKNTLVFHCRNERAAQFANDFKLVFSSNIYVVSDFRGDSVAEAKNDKMPIDKILKSEATSLLRSDGCLFVSNHLKHVLENRSGVVQGKSAVFYCTADEGKYAFNSMERIRIRKLHDLGNSPVVLYSGSIGRWHCFDKVLELSKRLSELNEDIKFLFLVNELQDANSQLRQYEKLHHRVTILTVSPDDVASYLSAGDVALLLRRTDPINASASPVKFAEYVLSGLKIVISSAICDYAQFAINQKLGWVLNDLSIKEIELISNSINKYFNNLSGLDRNEINTSIKKLSKKYHANNLCEFYNSL
jgi:glycosyltransferase involved in cell wall biosynthesis